MRATWQISVHQIWPSDGSHVSRFRSSDLAVQWTPRVSQAFVRNDRSIGATWLVSVRQIWAFDECHVAHFHALDLTVQSWPRGSFSCVRSHRPLWPRGSFLCVGSGHPIAATWLVPLRRISATWLALVHRIWSSDECHVVHLRASDLAVRSRPRGLFPCIGSGRTISATCLVPVRQISATWLVSERRICPSDICHMSCLHALDLTIRSPPRVFFVRQI